MPPAGPSRPRLCPARVAPWLHPPGPEHISRAPPGLAWGGGGAGAPAPPPPPPPPPAPAPRFPHPLVRRLGGDEDPDGPGLRGYCPFSLDLEPCEWRPVQLKPGAGSEKAPKEPRIKFLWG